MRPMTLDFFLAVYEIAHGRLRSASAASETMAGPYQDLDGVVAMLFDILAVQDYTQTDLLDFFGELEIGNKAQDFMKDLNTIYHSSAPQYIERDALSHPEWPSVVEKARESVLPIENRWISRNGEQAAHNIAEYEASKNLLRNQEPYGVTEAEHKMTQQRLNYYREKLPKGYR